MNTQELGNIVRNWVHYDNLTSSLSKQTQSARKIRDEFETKILQQLHVHNMETAVIQIQGGRLVVSEEKHTQPLTLSRIEEGLHAFYAEQKLKSGGRPVSDETGSIMKFLKSHRDVEVVKRLKKQAAVPPLPPLPPLPTLPS